MNKTLLIVGVLTLLVIGGGALAARQLIPQPIACTTEAKICPDGSAVGRTGPKCEFAACPSPTASPTPPKTNTAHLGQTISDNGILITPLEVVSDSRCPTGVTCIWAGTVELRVKLEEQGKVQEMKLTLDTPITFGGMRVVLVGVTPKANAQNPITPADYRFTFSVTGVTSSTTTGTLAGTMTIGPICPVEYLDTTGNNRCKPSPDMFAARPVSVYASNHTTLVATLIPDASGAFSATLEEGTYYVTMPQQGIGFISGVPATITINRGQTSVIAIAVDTGIR